MVYLLQFNQNVRLDGKEKVKVYNLERKFELIQHY